MFGGSVRALVEVRRSRRRESARSAGSAAPHDDGRGDRSPVARCPHQWDRMCTTVLIGKPVIVEYSCRRCAAWTVTEEATWTP